MTLHSGPDYVIITLVLAVAFLSTLVNSEIFFERRDHSDQEQYDRHRTATLVHTELQAENWLRKYGYLGDCRSAKKRKRRDSNPEQAAQHLMDDVLEEGVHRGGQSGTLRGNINHECTKTQITAAIKKYQKMYNLPQTGMLDRKTKQHMNSRRCGNKDTGDDLPLTPTELPTKPSATPPPKRRRRRSTAFISEGSAPSSHELNAPPNSKETTVTRRLHRRRTLSEIMRTSRRKRSLVMNANQTSKVMFSKKVIHYRILESGYSTKISIDEQWRLLDFAFRMWSEVIPISFEAQPHGDVRSVDVKVAFGRGSHQNCYHDFDGSGGEMAHAWFTGDMHFDDDEDYRNDDSDGVNIMKVIVHEAGHVLGLKHSERASSIMYGVYDAMLMGKQFELGWRDRKEIQKIYGTCKGSFSVIMDWVRIDVDGKRVYNTYFFRPGRYWMYENIKNRTRYGDPQITAAQWKGLPSDLDGFAHLLYWDITRRLIVDSQYFFHGCLVYKFDAQNNVVEPGWRNGKNINQVFPGMPCNIDTVFFDPRDKYLYFFKGDRVYVHNPQSSHCCVRQTTISAEFPSLNSEKNKLPSDLDSVYYSYKDDAQYFFKGDHVWQNVRFGRLRRPGNNRIRYMGEWSDTWFDICDVD